MARVDDALHEHSKVISLLCDDEAAALGLWTLALTWVSRNRGATRVAHVPADLPERLFPGLGNAYAAALVRHGLWLAFGDGWVFDESDDLFRWGRIKQCRPWIPLWLRRRVYARDGHRCLDCGATEDLTLHHRWPWSLGGEDTEENLEVLCRSCNSKRGAKV